MPEGGEPPQSFTLILLEIFTGWSAQAGWALLGMTFLILLSGFASGSEVAFFSISAAEQKEMRDKKKHGLVLRLLQKPRYLLATILIANNVVNIAMVLVSYIFIHAIFDFSATPVTGFAVEVLLVTFLIVLFGEIIPKVFATQNKIEVASLIAFPLFVLSKVFYPLSLFLVKSTSLIERKLKKSGNNLSVEEINDAIDLTATEDTSDQEINILKGIVNFGSINVKQAMKARVDVVAIDYAADFSEVVDLIKESGFSRIPVYERDLDHVKGVLYAKDLLAFLHKKQDFPWQTLLKPTFFIPETKKLNDLLKDFQSKRNHMAVVVDEYGGTSGIITLEDVMEEIIGEIKDEFDDVLEIDYRQLDDYNYIFEAKTMINDLCRAMDIPTNTFDEVKGESDSLGGLILEIAQKIPGHNEEIDYEIYRFKIMSADKKRIKRVKVTKLQIHSNESTDDKISEAQA